MINSEFVQNKHYMVEIKSELVLIKIDMGLVGWGGVGVGSRGGGEGGSEGQNKYHINQSIGKVLS